MVLFVIDINLFLNFVTYGYLILGNKLLESTHRVDTSIELGIHVLTSLSRNYYSPKKYDLNVLELSSPFHNKV